MKTQTTVIALLLAGNFAVAQKEPAIPEDRRENIEAVKIAFITKEVDLTPEEAQRFWPVYNQFQSEQEAIRKEKRQDKKETGKKIEDLSDAEVEKLMDKELIMQQQELDIRKKYDAEFKKVLPIKKVARFYMAQQNFHREVLRKMRDNHDIQRPHVPKPPHPKDK